MERIKDIFDRIYETDALIVKPAVAEELSRCQRDLTEIGMPMLPADYIEFLQEGANGVSWNGFEFFGTYQVTVKASGYTLRDIVTMNVKYGERKFGMEGKLLLGRFDDDIYVYDAKTREFQALDSLTLTEIDTYDSFEDLFIDNVSAYLDYDDEDPGADAYD